MAARTTKIMRNLIALIVVGLLIDLTHATLTDQLAEQQNVLRGAASPWLWPHPNSILQSTTPKKQKRIAVIGAGPGGSSFAYYAAQAFPNNEVSIDVYEASERAGGRCHSATLEISAALGLYHPVEWGASIFIDKNRNLVTAARAFNLSLGTPALAAAKQQDTKALKSPPFVTSLWDGSKILFELDLAHLTWRDKLRAALRYGAWTPGQVTRLARTAADRLDPVYDHKHPGYDKWADLVRDLGLEAEVQVSAAEYCRKHDVRAAYTDEVVEAVTRINYGRNLDEVHALAALVGMTNGETYSVVGPSVLFFDLLGDNDLIPITAGGNQQIFGSFLAASKATVHWNTTVTGIARVTDNDADEIQYQLETTKDNAIKAEPYDAVVLAVPIPAARRLSLPPTSASLPRVAYHRIHVTHVLGVLNRTTFPSRPAMVMTTRASAHLQSVSRVRDYAGILDGPGIALYKAFSTVPLLDHDGEGGDQLGQVVFERIDRIWNRTWWSYPIMAPVSPSGEKDAYAPVVLDQQQPQQDRLGDFKNGIYLLNGFETFLSTMETATIAAKNVVRLLQQQQ
ncbi:hypothetical protein BC828DRAFT_390966 [Blastocladiella britannica]|nr:hypothetical protein BC828DRAFT_390966 [Blastocladiella britannica]